MSIEVNVLEAAGLASRSGKPKTRDSYAILRIGNIERRTRTVKSSLKPRFNEEFEFCEVSQEHALLRVALYDADPLSDHCFLGEIIVPICSLSEADEKPTWRPLEVRPGSTEFVSGELCVRMKCIGDSALPRPQLSKRSSIQENALERTSFGKTPFSRPFVISPSELSFKEGAPLGQGGFGTVRCGYFRGLEVAVKTLLVREGVKKSEIIDEFRSEVAMLAKVSHHPKLCLFLGASLVEPLSVVSELMTGSVRNILDKPHDEALQMLPWRRRVAMLLDSALGMAYLHGMNVVHRDMKADNLLLDEHGTTKVADFGLSKTLAHNAVAWSEVGTPGFKAPEIYLGETEDEARDGPGYSLPVDVFAFGCTIYELLTFCGKNYGWPYGWALDLCTDEQVERAVLARKPPSALGGTAVPSDCPPKLCLAFEHCIAYDASARPTFEELVPVLRELLRSLSDEGDGECEGSGSSNQDHKRRRRR